MLACFSVNSLTLSSDLCQTIDMSDDGPTPAEGLALLIKETQAVLHQRMDERLRPLGLSVPQYACLQTLRTRPGITGSELARRVFVSRQSMNVLIQGLEKRGLIERSDQPGPRRERATVLTSAARDLLDQAQVRVGGLAESMTGDLATDDVAHLSALLTACRDALLAAAPSSTPSGTSTGTAR
ncbi:DNA-binding transcriptional regulator, MarR family [Promicromonospora thailandica]|uniref:DNA-binding transcriptional regulator, MarR family n=2 Tax=Promicromonospora thailandica TaxID=765201 RepID=A0A9X2K0G3_9MICO|nr:DNA-binding transcriptional regulator, MarR family [Promicromonospora thailandica]